ncbi:MAG: 4a-hydroxytetrahydrobiopterin dehydratase [Spirochaetaceae bacterium]|nr:MAG: 4a-hydroxytetrahydrobiopterin dehydratase [Spirochaetaceae bacterium]
MENMTDKKCIPCAEGSQPLSEADEKRFIAEISGWMLDRKKIHAIHKLFKLADFRKAVEFVNRIADLAEEEGHHPDIYLSSRYVTIALWTKKIFGLSENDFILAAKIDNLFEKEMV